MHRFQLLFALAVSALLSGSGSAIAQNSDAYCSNYAREAANAATLIRNMTCDFDESHPQWNTDSTAHEKWCLSASHSDVEQERQNRAAKVGDCTACRDYAQDAVKQVTLARKYWCQRADLARWSANEGDHFGWCMRLEGIDGRIAERGRRTAELDVCLHRNPEYCQQYAEEAVQAAKSVFVDEKCGIIFPDIEGLWSANYNDHLKFCQSEQYNASEQKRGRRTQIAASCETCRTYAKKAMKLLNLAKANGCSVGGARWTADENNHFFWCRQNQTEHASWLTTEEIARQGELDACRASVAKPLRSQSNSTPSGLGQRKQTGVTTLREASPQRKVRAGTGGGSLGNADPQRSVPAKPPSSGGGNSAMDRLGGGSINAVPGWSGGVAGGGARAAPRSGGTPAAGGTAASPPSSPTVDYGGAPPPRLRER